MFSLFRILQVDESRKSRFHDQTNCLMPLQEFLMLPFEVILRLMKMERSGPWMSRNAVKFLDKLLAEKFMGKARVLEIGGGNSTPWLAERCHSLVTLELDAEWAKIIKKKSEKYKDRVKVFNASFESFSSSTQYKLSEFDLIIVDGESDTSRLDIAKRILNSVQGTILVLDNSDRRIFNPVSNLSRNREIISKNGLIRNPLQVTRTTFFI